ncbi:hypothetical protein PVAND_010544 [Polypedilum vanderplanki]|uniref:Uncharacterized protein n=1 Tax=Polypedilum vanderplanki TaxID=319348 RepID=A0A9J6CHL0_POLVA|nr:hypothetical protein PVAND_010544 [Polypedilum vanderplanki]
MFGRSNREFKPLVSMQIRLRNLIKITGINFDCDNKYDVYFTLHFSAFSKPFYTSKSVKIKNNKADWPEINCEQYRTSSHRFICIRVWQTMIVNNENNNSLKSINESVNNNDNKMLFLWGIYFSGLVVINPNSETIKFKQNTLLFHLDGGIFTSSEQILYQNQQQHQINNINYNSNNNVIIPSSLNEEADFKILPQDCDKRDGDNKYSVTNNFSINNANKYYHQQIEKSNSPSISSSPNANDHEKILNQNIDIVEILNEMMYHKVRYVSLEFPKNEIQCSYSLEKLLKMQEDQREYHSRIERNKLLANKICVKSPACLDLNLIMTKPVFYEPQKRTGMGKTLSKLLTQAPPKPELLLKSHDLKIKIECARFRIKLLTQERDRIKQYNKQLMAKREKLKDDNTEMETLTWNSFRTLNRENLRVYEEKLALQREVFTNVKLALSETRRFLLKELNEIYRVKKSDRIYTINGIHLPDAESYGESQSTPIEISIALGYVAHAVLIIAKIINIPLRNAIIHEGSRSKIMDNIKVLAPSDRVFPLFCRMTPPPNVLLYGVYLLNQNISQLKFMLNIPRGDLRATLANLWDLMNGINAEMRHFVEDVKPTENSASSMDSVPINVPLSLTRSLNRRKSRSLEDFEDVMEDFRENINLSAPDLLRSNPRIEKQIEQI